MRTIFKAATYVFALSAVMVMLTGSVNAQNSMNYKDSSAIRLARADGGGACNATKPQESTRSFNVQDKDSDVAVVEPQDSQLAEYLELHERADKQSLRASLMPWSAL